MPTRYRVAIAVLAILLANGCRSSSDTGADTATSEFVSESVSLADLPEAGAARSVVAISDDRALISGGLAAEDLGTGEDNIHWFQFNAIDQLWLLESTGEVTTLPALPRGDGMVTRIGSAFEVDDVIIADLYECGEVRAEFFGCGEHGRTLIGTLSPGEASWDVLEYPPDAFDGLEWPDEVGHRGYRIRLLGTTDDGNVVLALHATDAVRFGDLEPTTGSFNQWHDSVKQYDRSQAPYYCLHDSNIVINRIAHGNDWELDINFEAIGPEGVESSPDTPSANGLPGHGEEADNHVTLRCIDDREPEVVLAADAGQITVGTIDPETLNTALDDRFPPPPLLADETTEYSIIGSLANGDLLLRISHIAERYAEPRGFYRFSEDGQLNLVEGLDSRHQPFSIGNTLVTVNTATGAVNVEQG